MTSINLSSNVSVLDVAKDKSNDIISLCEVEKDHVLHQEA